VAPDQSRVVTNVKCHLHHSVCLLGPVTIFGPIFSFSSSSKNSPCWTVTILVEPSFGSEVKKTLFS
jgi:hypothetical protein